MGARVAVREGETSLSRAVAAFATARALACESWSRLYVCIHSVCVYTLCVYTHVKRERFITNRGEPSLSQGAAAFATARALAGESVSKVSVCVYICKKSQIDTNRGETSLSQGAAVFARTRVLAC